MDSINTAPPTPPPQNTPYFCLHHSLTTALFWAVDPWSQGFVVSSPPPPPWFLPSIHTGTTYLHLPRKHLPREYHLQRRQYHAQHRHCDPDQRPRCLSIASHSHPKHYRHHRKLVSQHSRDEEIREGGGGEGARAKKSRSFCAPACTTIDE